MDWRIKCENIQPQVFENYMVGFAIIAEHQIYLRVTFHLKDYLEKLWLRHGLTLSGDDKGIAEIFAMLRFYVAHPEVSRPDIWVACPDEEIGRGADRFPWSISVDFLYHW